MYLAWQLGVEVLPMWRLSLEMLAFSNQVSQADSPSFSKVFVFFISVSIKTKKLKIAELHTHAKIRWGISKCLRGKS